MKRFFFSFFLSILLHTGYSQFNDSLFSYSCSKNTVVVQNDNSIIKVEAWCDNIFRISWFPDMHNIEIDSSHSVILNQAPEVKFSVKEKHNELIIKGRLIVAKITKIPFNISFYKPDGSILLQSAGAFECDGSSKKASFKIRETDHFYGMGQKSIAVDRRGEAFEVFNQHIGGYTKPYGTMQINIPYIYSTTGFGVYFDNQYPARFDLGKTNPTEWYYEVENGSFTYYLLAAPNEQSLLKSYFDLTGYPPLQPKWIYGLIQSKCSYENDTMVYNTLQKFEQKKLPVDAIVLDIPWFGGLKPTSPHFMGNFSWNLQNFPDPIKYINTLRGKNVKTILINEPYINLDSYNYKFLKEKRWLVSKKNQSEPYVFSPFWAGDVSLFDITHPDAQKWLWQQLKAEVEFGADGLWSDLVEPESPVVDGQFYLGDWRKVHNIYSLLWAKNIYDGFSTDFPNKRITNLSRAGFGGIQRYGALCWSGDASKTWFALKLQIPMMTGTVLSGIPYFSSDIGGFTFAHDRRDGNTIFTNIVDGRMKTEPELYIRWFQHGVFSPMLRPHSGEEQFCEVFAFDSLTESITTKYLHLRYRLIPYMYSYSYKTYKKGETLIRPLFFEFSDSLARKQDYQYMFGKEMLVAPVLDEGKTHQQVYLPSENQTWIDFWSNKTYRGGQTIDYNAPLDIIPVFVKAGSIIPLAKNKMRAEEPDDTLTLRIYPDKTAKFEIYEDDNKTKNYQKGEFGITNITSWLCNHQLTINIDAMQGEFENKITERTWIIEIPVSAECKSIKLNNKKLTNFTFDKKNGMLHFEFKADTRVKQKIQIDKFRTTY